MSTPCSGAVSTPKAGIPPGIVVDQVYVQSLLPPALAFLYPYVPYMHALQIGDVTAFCLADPPSFALPTPAQFLSFVTGGNLGQLDVVEAFMENITKAFLWNQICQCTGGGTPTAPTPPANPGTLPVVNPPNVVTPPGTSPCKSLVGPTNTFTPSSSLTLAGLSHVGFNVTGYRITVTAAPHTAPGFGGTLRLEWQDQTVVPVVVLKGENFAIGATTNLGFNVIGVAGTNVLVPSFTASAGTGSEDLQVTVDAYCNGAVPNGTSSPCCPPDPTLVGQVQQILQAVTLLQRQIAPFAYVTSTVHAGLTGTGNIEVSGLLGISVTLTTIPGRLGQIVGTPVEIFDAGYVTWGCDDGYEQTFRVTHPSHVSLPPRASAFTDVGYSFAVGVVATITELLREP